MALYQENPPLEESKSVVDESEVKIVPTIEEAEQVIEEHECANFTKFVIRDTDRTFGVTDWKPAPGAQLIWSKKSVNHSANIAYDGIPFMFVAKRYMTCHQGPDCGKSTKSKYARECALQKKEDHNFAKTRRLVQNTKKLDCPAKLSITQIAKFPDFKVDGDSEPRRSKKDNVKKSLQAELMANPNSVKIVMQYVVRLPGIREHVGHPTGNDAAAIREPMDKRIRAEICGIFGEGARKVPEVQRRLKAYVKKELFKDKPCPGMMRRRFFPTSKDIRNVGNAWKSNQCTAANDQDTLAKQIEQWQIENPQDNFYFRPHLIPTNDSEGNMESPMLFCYQTKWQRDLLLRYGTQMCLLDATYRTTRYTTPLFLFCVRTNVAYSVVGAFVTEQETTGSIREGLEIFKDWNPEWEPRNFMVDFCTPEMTALQTVWPGANIRLCDFHRERAWTENCNKHTDGADDRDRIIDLMRNIAHAHTLSAMEAAIQKLKESPIWLESDRLRTWFNNKWLSNKKCWANALLDEELAICIRTNNGLERQNETLKDTFLDGYRNCSLNEMVTVLVEKFFPHYHSKYIVGNIQSSDSYRKYSEDIPKFLHNRPRDMVTHIMLRMHSAQDVKAESIKKVSSTTFTVASETNASLEHVVCFGTATDMPKCSCQDWYLKKLPCKHFCAVFQHYDSWSWDQLSQKYRENPVFTLDPWCFDRNSRHGEMTPTNETEDQRNNQHEATCKPLNISWGQCTDDLGRDETAMEARKIKIMHKLASIFRELQYLTFDQVDVDFMLALTEKASEIRAEMKEKIPKDGGLSLCLSEKKRKAGQVGTLKLKKRKTNKHNGAQTANGQMEHQKAGTIPTLLTSSQAECNNVKDDKLTPDMGVVESISTKTVPADGIMCGTCEPKKAAVKKVTPGNLSRRSLSTKRNKYTCRVGKKAEMMKRHSSCHMPSNQGSSDEPIIISEGEDNPTQMLKPWCKVNGIKLTTKDKETIEQGKWLDDNIINAAQYLLRRKFPSLSAAEDTQILFRNWKDVSSKKDVIQCHYINSHWVMSTSIGGKVKVYDSQTTQMPDILSVQLRNVYKSHARGNGRIPVHLICAQEQIGGSDCGLFAIANCVALAHGFDPTEIHFHQGVMRKHLENCFQEQHMKMFPHTKSDGHPVCEEKCTI